MIDISPQAVVIHPPHGFVNLQAAYASDLDVVNAARVSFSKESEWDHEYSHAGSILGEKLKEDDAALVRWMLKYKHGSPFEHNYFKFHIRAPIFVFREWHRHRIGISINEESARYVELQPDFYYPDDEHCRKQVGKPGRYTYEPMLRGECVNVRTLLKAQYEDQYKTYQSLIEYGAAKEIARAVLPVGIYSQMIWSCNARSLMAFLSLRNAPTAQREIHDYAEVMEEMFMAHMPVTCQAFIDNGRVAP